MDGGVRICEKGSVVDMRLRSFLFEDRDREYMEKEK